jgi:hypothetical protein
MLLRETEVHISWIDIYVILCKPTNSLQVNAALPHNLMCNPLTGQAVSRKVKLTR